MNRLKILALHNFCDEHFITMTDTMLGAKFYVHCHAQKLKKYCQQNTLPLKYNGGDNYSIELISTYELCYSDIQ